MEKPISISGSIIVVHLLAVILFAGSTFDDGEFYCNPYCHFCPWADDIFPCTCKMSEDGYQVFCNNMTSVDRVLPILEHNFQLEITRLSLTHVHSSSLPSGTLGRVTVKHLEILDGDISQIDKDAFLEQDSMKSLYLDRNRLDDVPTEALQNLSVLLETLSLSGNRLKNIRNGSLSYLGNLLRLNLSGNLISEIDQNAFPDYVYELNISENSLTTFNGSLKSLKYLSKLEASHNRLTSIKGEFDNDRLMNLTLDYNRISDISEFSKLFSLQRLSLAGNRIRNVGESIASLERLQELNLAQNSIRNIPPKVFLKLNKLYHLDLSGNFLKAIEICPSATSSYPHTLCSLRNVDLSRNQLSALSSTGSPWLETLNISFNNFRSLKTLKKLQQYSPNLMMEGNPICRSRRRRQRPT